MELNNTRRGFTQQSYLPKGFTLIELLVVVLIIGILAAVALPQYQLAMEKSKAMSLLPLMKSILTGQQRYLLENGNGTYNVSQLDIDFPYTKITGYTTYSRRYHVDKERLFIVYSASDKIIYSKHKKNDENTGDYSITLYKDGKRICQPASSTNSTWIKFCQSLGKLKEGSTNTYEF